LPKVWMPVALVLAFNASDDGYEIAKQFWT
jgi:hypothetical protein